MEKIILEDAEKMEKYEDLILERDELLCVCDNLEIEYQKLFGNEVIDIFKEEMECVKLKKMIAYVQKKKNNGEEIKPVELNLELEKEMLIYNTKLEKMMFNLESSKEAKYVSPYETQEVKKIYRKIAKVIHPDCCDIDIFGEDIGKLWSQVYNAYRNNNLKAIREASILLNKKLKDNNIIPIINVSADNLDELINDITEEIMDIKVNVPYTYKDWLYDNAKVKEKHAENKKQLVEYKEYKKELESIIEDMKIN